MAYNSHRGPQYILGTNPGVSGSGTFTTTDISASGQVHISGNVGIGTASPAKNLHLYGSSGEVELRIQSDTSYCSIVQKDNAELIIQNAAANGVLIFHDDTAERMRIDKDGKVGVGTSNPTDLLTVAGGISGSGTFITTDLSASGQVHISGNVGIKTDTPLYDLHINGTGVTGVGIQSGPGADAYLRFLDASSPADTDAYIKRGSGGNLVMTNDTAASHLLLQARAASGAAYTFLALDGGNEMLSSSVAFHNDGAVTLSATLATTGSITAGGNILPAADNTLDLGSAAKRWANLYTGDLHLKNNRGDWSVVEEEEYLSVINNKTGKKYKFVLEEIED